MRDIRNNLLQVEVKITNVRFRHLKTVIVANFAKLQRERFRIRYYFLLCEFPCILRYNTCIAMSSTVL